MANRVFALVPTRGMNTAGEKREWSNVIKKWTDDPENATTIITCAVDQARESADAPATLLPMPRLNRVEGGVGGPSNVTDRQIRPLESTIDHPDWLFVDFRDSHDGTQTWTRQEIVSVLTSLDSYFNFHTTIVELVSHF